MKLSTAKRRINKTLDELTQSVIDDWYDHFKNGYIKGYTDAREGVAPMYADAIADTPQTEVEEVCDRADRNCNECWKQLHCRAKDTPQMERKSCTLELFDDDGNYIEPQTDCGWK